jgi:pimeloyl-ACP methyl ester carboxylesterase
MERLINWNGHRTWARIEGELDDVVRPLIALHGGPGLPSDYLAPLAGLAREGTPVVLYDQLGKPAEIPEPTHARGDRPGTGRPFRRAYCCATAANRKQRHYAATIVTRLAPRIGIDLRVTPHARCRSYRRCGRVSGSRAVWFRRHRGVSLPC